ncbi:aromatic amino acid lyase [Candidatus Roizmanbacteria bacterium]|nr:aromatic amino acid lyase [Candidatus Roizmanbacteria bacterium]
MTSSKFSSLSLVSIIKQFSKLPENITLTGTSLTIPEIIAVARNNTEVKFTEDKNILAKIEASYDHMMKDVVKGVPVYGTNTGYGARASHVLVYGSQSERIELARKISEGIVHVDVSVGPIFEKEVVRAAMLIRINMLMQGVSAVKIEDLDIYRKMLNKQITPLVNQYGGIGASGDLAHNGRILSAARQLKGILAWDKNDKIGEARKLLRKEKIPILKLRPKAGLGFVNGDNFSTAMACLLAIDTLELMLIAIVTGAIAIEVLKGSDRSFHPMLAKVRPHPGQKEVADVYRYLLKGSKLVYQEMDGHKRRPEGVKVQDGYSLRAIAQYHGVSVEKLKSAFEVIDINANSVSDNPLWVTPEFVNKGEKPWQWVSGGNFLAMHMAEIMDSLRKTLTHIVKLNDRHLAKLVNPNENNGLSPNLSDKAALTHCSFKGVQIQSGMFEVYSSLLSIPISTFFGTHEEGNQDITSHALTSGILGLENLRLARYSTAQNLLAVTQAVDLRGGAEKLSPHTQPLYYYVRKRVEFVKKERPLNREIEMLYESIKNGELLDIVTKKVFKDF